MEVAGDLNKVNTSRIFNNQSWDMHIQLLDLNNNLTVSLFTERINLLHIYNSLECWSPHILLIYNDYGFVLSKYIKSTGLALKVSIKAPPTDLNEEASQGVNINNNPEFNHIYIVNNVKLVSKNEEMNTYEFNGILNNNLTLIKNFNYATNKETGPVSPYRIISDILNAANYPLNRNYTDTSQKIDFITSQNMTIEDSIRYCLNLGVSKNDPPTYFVHNLIKNEAQLINQCSRLETIYNPYNNKLGIYTKEGIDNQNLATAVTDISTEAPNGGLLNLQGLSTYEFNNYDHNKRQWKKYVYSSSLMKQTLANITGNEKIYTRIFTPTSMVDEAKLKQSYPNFTYNKMYNILRNLEFCSDTVQFLIFGNLTRDAGQVLSLDVKTDKLYSNLNGLWWIYQCVHKWEDKTYTNDITCYRTMNMKPVLNSDK
jgi:hypothetical protein